VRDHSQCGECIRLREKGVADHCPEWYGERKRDVMRKRDSAIMARSIIVLKDPEVEWLFNELHNLTRTLITGEDAEENRKSTKLLVRFERLRFELSQLLPPQPPETVESRLERYPLPPLDVEYLRRWEIGYLESAIRGLDERVAACTVEGVDVAEPFLVRLRLLRHRLRGKLRREQRRVPAKAKAASA
jgi:hypothetical protein